MDKYYRVSARNPIHSRVSKTDLKMWTDGNVIVGSLKYWQFANEQIDDLTNLSLLTGLNAVNAAEALFGFNFTYCPTRGLCYDGVACSRHWVGILEMLLDDGTPYIVNEDNSIDKDRPFWIWQFTGEEIAPLPEGDGFIVKPEHIVGREPALQALYDADSLLCGNNRGHVLYPILIECCAEIEDYYGNTWITRSSPQYKLYERFKADGGMCT